MDISKSVRYFYLLFFVVLVIFVQEQLCVRQMGSRIPVSSPTCPTLRLQSGKVRLRSKGRVARFNCNEGFKVFGDKTATCVGGRWRGKIPKCVKSGCLRMAPPDNGVVIQFLGGAVLSFVCNNGYRLTGPPFLSCNGLVWNGTTPTCAVESTEPELSCDFESEGLCGWTQDPQHNFDWTRHRFATPSGHVGTGPSFDHTRGQNQDGYYIYIESSGRRTLNDSAQLFSPVYSPDTSEDACLIFWYHMYGATTGSLNVYQKREGVALASLKPLFSQSGDQGNQWFRGLVRLENSDKPYQVILEGVPGRGYLGDTAIDDVQLTNGSDCLEPIRDITEASSKVETGGGGLVFSDAQSCRHRCSSVPEPPALPLDNSTVETPVMVTCECHVGCLENDTCCPDYSQYCILGKLWQQPHQATQGKSPSASMTIGIVGGVALLLVAFGIVAFAVVRRRRLAMRGRDISDDSDVRFLTADEVLDFNMARPTEEDDSC